MVQIVTNVDDTEFWSMVFGSAGESWEWWTVQTFLEGDWNVPGRVLMEIEDPEAEGFISKELTIEDIAKAYGKYQEMGPGAVSWEDLDASSADAILQIAVLGDIVYG